MPTPWMRSDVPPDGKPHWWRYRDHYERGENGAALEYQTDEERAIDALKERYDRE